MTIDLGEGTTEAYMGGPTRERCAVWHDVEGHPVAITQRQLLTLSLALQHGNAEAGYRLDTSLPGVRHVLTRLYHKLGVFSKWEAAVELGWVHVPPELLDAPSSLRGRAGTARPVVPAHTGGQS